MSALSSLWRKPEPEPASRQASYAPVDPRNPLPIPLAMSAPAELDHELIKAGFDQVGAEAHRHATAAGFWANKDPKLAVYEKMCLVITEVGEAIEHLRYGRWETTKRIATEKETEKEGNYEVDEEGFLDELADIAIRLADLCWALKLDLAGAIIRKLYKNRKRPFAHGGRAF